jgi:hypothetical protein
MTGLSRLPSFHPLLASSSHHSHGGSNGPISHLYNLFSAGIGLEFGRSLAQIYILAYCLLDVSFNSTCIYPQLKAKKFLVVKSTTEFRSPNCKKCSVGIFDLISSLITDAFNKAKISEY